jgi:hypothetical protein
VPPELTNVPAALLVQLLVAALAPSVPVPAPRVVLIELVLIPLTFSLAPSFVVIAYKLGPVPAVLAVIVKLPLPLTVVTVPAVTLASAVQVLRQDPLIAFARLVAYVVLDPPEARLTHLDGLAEQPPELLSH